MMRLRLRNGRVIDPANGIDSKGDVCIADGKIVSVLDKNSDFNADQDIDASNKIVSPGLVDLCARLREPGLEHKATIASESLAAISSGITSICCPPDTQPIVDTTAVAELIQQRADSTGKLSIYPLGALTLSLEGKQLSEMRALKRAGCVGVSNAGKDIVDTAVLRHALEYAHSCAMPVILQAQDYHLGKSGVAHEGPVATRLGLPAIPDTAETIAVSRALHLIERIGGPVHFGRLSCASSVELISRAKQAGLPVSADVGVCHLHLTEMDIDGYNADCHLQPPLRSQSDKDILCQAVSSGTIDAICSDHQPHNEDAKSAPFAETDAGASTIEHLLPLTLALVEKGLVSLNVALASLTCRPASVLGLSAGTLSADAPADVIVIDLEQRQEVDRAKLLSAGKNTPFHGWELNGRVQQVIRKGSVVFDVSSS